MNSLNDDCRFSEDPFIAALNWMERSVEQLSLPGSVYEQLKSIAFLAEAAIPVEMDDGNIKTFTAYRAQHNNALGPYKGGIRFHPLAAPEKVKALAVLMTLKCALMGLPFGGAKGAVVCEPSKLSFREKERISRSYVRAMAPLLGPQQDIPGPDVGTDARVMAWMADEYSSLTGKNCLNAFTGKPPGLNGSLGRDEATSLGAFCAAKEAVCVTGRDLEKTRVAIQGCGNVGAGAARLFFESGCRVVALSNSKGAIYNPRGLNIPALLAHIKDAGLIKGFAGGETISNSDLLTIDCDLLMPSALENQITAANAAAVKASIVVEAANGPTTMEAEEILKEKGVLLVPDILANGGGVTVSYFEWVQNNEGFFWDLDTINSRLEKMMIQIFHAVYRLAGEKCGGDLRQAAYTHAVQRIAEAMNYRSRL